MTRVSTSTRSRRPAQGAADGATDLGGCRGRRRARRLGAAPSRGQAEGPALASPARGGPRRRPRSVSRSDPRSAITFRQRSQTQPWPLTQNPPTCRRPARCCWHELKRTTRRRWRCSASSPAGTRTTSGSTTSWPVNWAGSNLHHARSKCATIRRRGHCGLRLATDSHTCLKKWAEPTKRWRSSLTSQPAARPTWGSSRATAVFSRARPQRGRTDARASRGCRPRGTPCEPGDVRALIGLGITHLHLGKLDAAIADYREIIRRTPDNADAYHNLGVVFREQRRPAEAIAAYREAIRHKPNYAEAHDGVGFNLRALGKPLEAIAEYREAIRLNPDDYKVHYNLGATLCDDIHDYPAAAAAFRESIRLKPDYAEAHTGLGNALQAQDKLDESAVELREAIRLNPDLAAAHGSLGVGLMKQGKLDEAIAEDRAALRLNPAFAVVRSNLVLALQQRGDYAAGLAELRKGNELTSKVPGARTSYERKLQRCTAGCAGRPSARPPLGGRPPSRQHRSPGPCPTGL